HPVLGQLAVGDTIEGHAGDRRVLAGRRNAEQLAFVRSADGHADGNPVFFGDHVLDRVVDVGEGATELCDERLDAFGTRRLPRVGVVHVAGSDQLVDDLQVPRVPDL